MEYLDEELQAAKSNEEKLKIIFEKLHQQTIHDVYIHLLKLVQKEYIDLHIDEFNNLYIFDTKVNICYEGNTRRWKPMAAFY